MVEQNKPPTDPITSNAAIRENVEGGSNASGFVISAKFFLSPDLRLSKSRLLRAGRSAKSNMRRPVKRMVRKGYSSSGLKVRSGVLLGQALNRFEIFITVKTTKQIVLEVIWKPSVPYFVAHDQGQGGKGSSRKPITVRTADWLHFKVGNQWVRVKEVKLPKRQFIKMTPALRKGLEVVLEKAIQSEIAGKIGRAEERLKERRKTRKAFERAAARRRPQRPISPRELKLARKDIRRAVDDAAAVTDARRVVKAAGRRPTDFRIRKTLRAGGLSPADARKLARQFNQVIQSGVLTQRTVGLLGSRLRTPPAQAVIRSVVSFQASIERGSR